MKQADMVIVVEGGVVQDIFGPEGLRVAIVDHDEAQAGGKLVAMCRPEALDSIDAEVAEYIVEAIEELSS